MPGGFPGFLVPILHMNGESSDDPQNLSVPMVDMDTLTSWQGDVVPPDRLEIDETVLVDILDDKGQLIRVTTNQYLWRTLGVQDCQGVPVVFV